MAVVSTPGSAATQCQITQPDRDDLLLTWPEGFATAAAVLEATGRLLEGMPIALTREPSVDARLERLAGVAEAGLVAAEQLRNQTMRDAP